MIEHILRVQVKIIGIIILIVPFFNFHKIQGQNNTDLDLNQNLRILSYNIHHANPPSIKDSIDLNSIINVIKNSNADLIALQEIDSRTERYPHENQAILIGKAIGYHVFFGKAIDFQNGEYGVAILSRFPIIESKLHKLPSNEKSNGEPRVLAMSLIKLPNETAIWFANTHLDSQKKNTNRLLQIQKIIKITEKEALPIIIAGDFNDLPESEVINLLDNKFKRTCKNCLPTIPTHSPEKAIDFIAFKPKTYFRTIDHQVITEKYASDHLPILSIIQLEKR